MTRVGVSAFVASVLSLVLLLQCRPDARPPQTVHDPSGAAAAPLPLEVAAVCDTVAGLWRATGQASVRLVDTTARVLSDSAPQRGCSVVTAAPTGIDSVRWSRLYWPQRDSRGWTDRPVFDADGPDGNNRTRDRGKTRCEIGFTQDGGDDSDSTYVPSPAIGEITHCWRRAPQ